MLTESVGLVIKFAFYTEVLDYIGGKDHAANVVLHLRHEKLNNCHSLCMDKFIIAMIL